MASKESVEFEITLDSSGVAASAKSSADGLTRLESAIKKSQAEYTRLGKAMKDLQKGSSVDVELMRKLQAQHRAAGDRIAGLTTRTMAYRSEMRHSNRVSSESSSWLSRLREGSSKLSSEGLAPARGGVKGLFSNMLAANLVSGALTSALSALARGATSAASTIFRLAIANTDARRSELIHLEAMSKLYSVWGVVRETGGQVQQIIDDIAETSASGRSKLAGFAGQLQNMGMRGQNLADTLDAMGIIAATQGDEYAQRFAAMAQSTVVFGGSVKRMTDDVRARLGGLAQREAMGFSTQISKAKDNVAALFAGVNLTPFLAGLQKVLALFSQTSSTGRALKQLLSGLFSILFGQADQASSSIKNFVQDSVISLQELVLSFLRAGKTGPGAFSEIVLTHAERMASQIWPRVLPVILSGINTLASRILPRVATALEPVGAEIAKGIGIGLANAAGSILVNVLTLILSKDALMIGVVAGLLGDAFRALGMDVAGGIAAGIQDGAVRVLEAVVNLGAAIKEKFKNFLGIHSDSVVFKGEAKFISTGVATGIRSGFPAIRRATSDMVQVPSMTAQGVLAGGRLGGGGRGGSVTIANLTVNAGGSDAHSIALDIRAEIERVLEGAAIQMGAV